jgi:hypothetical protein
MFIKRRLGLLVAGKGEKKELPLFWNFGFTPVLSGRKNHK